MVHLWFLLSAPRYGFVRHVGVPHSSGIGFTGTISFYHGIVFVVNVFEDPLIRFFLNPLLFYLEPFPSPQRPECRPLVATAMAVPVIYSSET